MAIASVNKNCTINHNQTVLVSHDLLHNIKTLLNHKNNKCYIQIMDNNIVFYINDFIISSTILKSVEDLNYSNYIQQLSIFYKPDATINLNKAQYLDLVTFLKDAKKLLSDKVKYPISINADVNDIVFSVNTTTNKLTYTINDNIELFDNKLRKGCNCSYLLDSLLQLKTETNETIQINIYNEKYKPIIITEVVNNCDYKNSNFLYYIMPIML